MNFPEFNVVIVVTYVGFEFYLFYFLLFELGVLFLSGVSGFVNVRDSVCRDFPVFTYMYQSANLVWRRSFRPRSFF